MSGGKCPNCGHQFAVIGNQLCGLCRVVANAQESGGSGMKAGDRVEVLEDDANGATVNKGDTGVITVVYGPDVIQVKMDVERSAELSEWGFQRKYLRIVEQSAPAAGGTKPEGAAGGTKYDNGKPDLSLLPFKALEDVARVLQFGANRYGRNNWKQGFPEERLIAAALRHIGAYNEGELVDPDSGESHMAHAACNMLFLIWLKKNGEKK